MAGNPAGKACSKISTSPFRAASYILVAKARASGGSEATVGPFEGSGLDIFETDIWNCWFEERPKEELKFFGIGFRVDMYVSSIRFGYSQI